MGRFRFDLLCVLLAGALTACGQGQPPAGGKRAASLPLVETKAVVLQPMAQEIARSGTLRARREVTMAAQEEGRLIELPQYEGDHVRQGALVFRLDDALLAAELKKALSQLKQAELDLMRVERLQRGRLVTEEALQQARTAVDVARAEEALLRTRLGYTKVAAPFDGIVSRRLAEPGDIIPRFGPVLTVMDPGSLVTELTVSELVVPLLRVGDKAEVVVDALGAAAHPGRIVRIHPTINTGTRQGTVEVVLEPPPDGALPGQLCRVSLHSRETLRMTIPFAALRRDARGEYVYRVIDGRVHRTAVATGIQAGERIEVITGLAEGDAVVVRGFLGLADGVAVATVAGGRESQ